jgi:hypothetical protein
MPQSPPFQKFPDKLKSSETADNSGFLFYSIDRSGSGYEQAT